MTLETSSTRPATTPPTQPADAGGADGGWITARPPRVLEIVRRILGFPALIVRHHDLVGTSVKRELEGRFTGTVLGLVWPLVHPLFLFGVYYFIFTKLLNFKIPNLPDGRESALGVFMFVGIMVWASISEAMLRGTTSIVDNGNLIKKLSFPSEILPLNVTLVSQVTLLFAVLAFVVACLVTSMWTAPGVELVWVPVFLLVQTVFAYGLAMFLATLQVFLRDTAQVMSVLVTVWMFITPIFWVPELMGDDIEPFLGLIHGNPIYHLVQAWRGALMGDLAVTLPGATAPEPIISTAAIGSHVASFAAWALAFFVVGYATFIWAQRRFADEV